MTSLMTLEKTYTLTFRRPYFWRKNALGRCRFSPSSVMWIMPLSCTMVEAFAALLSGVAPFTDFRLVKCGKLIARAATYDGVTYDA